MYKKITVLGGGKKNALFLILVNSVKGAFKDNWIRIGTIHCIVRLIARCKHINQSVHLFCKSVTQIQLLKELQLNHIFF